MAEVWLSIAALARWGQQLERRLSGAMLGTFGAYGAEVSVYGVDGSWLALGAGLAIVCIAFLLRCRCSGPEKNGKRINGRDPREVSPGGYNSDESREWGSHEW